MFQAFAGIYIDNNSIKIKILNEINNSEFFKFLHNVFEAKCGKQKHYISNKIYNERNDLLKKIFDSTIYKNGLEEMNCATNVTYIVDKLISNSFNSCMEKKNAYSAITQTNIK